MKKKISLPTTENFRKTSLIEHKAIKTIKKKKSGNDKN
jgi:hypothetical protein